MKDFVEFCEILGLEVIPLVQTFGHLEFVLKHEEFAYLRDVPEMPESICPCHDDTMGVIKEIVDQVMKVHPKANYLHIGRDGKWLRRDLNTYKPFPYNWIINKLTN